MFSPDTRVHESLQPAIEQNGRFKLRQDVLHSTKDGKPHSGLAKEKRKAVEKLAPALEHFLEQDEVVLYMAKASWQPPALVQYTMGWYSYQATLTMLVFTNRRLLHLRVGSSLKWDKGVRQLDWRDVQTAEVKGWLGKQLRISFKDGKKIKYWQLSRRDALNIEKLLPLILNARDGGSTSAASMVHLCPSCKGELTRGSWQCTHCATLFKNKKTASLLALVPGAAYFYVGRPLLGFIDLLGQSWAYLFLLVAIFLFLNPPNTHDPDDPGPIVYLVIGIVIFAIDYLVSVHHSHFFVEDFVPTDKKGHPTSHAQAFAKGGTIG